MNSWRHPLQHSSVEADCSQDRGRPSTLPVLPRIWTAVESGPAGARHAHQRNTLYPLVTAGTPPSGIKPRHHPRYHPEQVYVTGDAHNTTCGDEMQYITTYDGITTCEDLAGWRITSVRAKPNPSPSAWLGFLDADMGGGTATSLLHGRRAGYPPERNADRELPDRASRQAKTSEACGASTNQGSKTCSTKINTAWQEAGDYITFVKNEPRVDKVAVLYVTTNLPATRNPALGVDSSHHLRAPSANPNSRFPIRSRHHIATSASY